MGGVGKSIRIYLADGTAAGIRHAELINWTGQAIFCPRVRVAELGTCDESARPGVYFLLGEEESGPRTSVYIGEAENVFERLRSHVRSTEFWTRVVFFTSKDLNLTKAHVKYLESRLVQKAKDVNRALLKNGASPQLPKLPRPDEDAMEEFLEPLQLLLAALGVTVLQEVAPGAGASSPEPGGIINKSLRFTTTSLRVNATGAVTDEGFVVYAGSSGDAHVKDHLGKASTAYREQLVAEGAIVIEGDRIRFTRDVLFTSPSAAAAVVAGGATNGREVWKDAEGRSLKALEEALAASETTQII